MSPSRRRDRERPVPEHPFKGSAILYAALALIIVLAAVLTGGDALQAVAVAAGFFVIATSWNWWRFSQRIRAHEARERQEAAARGRGNKPRGGRS
jgi:membrane protein implicated in regulation of membrane protease activity